MKVIEKILTKYLEIFIIVVIALIIRLVPGYRERFPEVITSTNGLCFSLALVGLIQSRILRNTKKAKAAMPLCVLSVIMAIVGVFIL